MSSHSTNQFVIFYNVLTNGLHLNFTTFINKFIYNIIDYKSNKCNISKKTYDNSECSNICYKTKQKCKYCSLCNNIICPQYQKELYHFDPAKSKIILYITPGALITGLIAYSRYKFVQAYAEFAVFFMSILHWHDPKFGWRRNLDMITVQLSLWIHIWLFYQSGCFPAFILMMVAVGCFYLSLHKSSFIMHGLGWITSCSSNLVLAYW